MAPYLTVDNIALALVMLGTLLFSVFAARAEERLWRKTHHIPYRRRIQAFITDGRARMR